MDGVKAEPDSEHVEVLLEQNFQLCLSVFLAKMIQLATRHIVTPTQLAFSSQSGLVTIVTTTRTRKMRENDNAGKKNAALNCSGGKCVNENVPQFPASVVLCRIFHFLHFQSSHNDNKWSMNSEEGRTVPALVLLQSLLLKQPNAFQWTRKPKIDPSPGEIRAPTKYMVP